MLRHDSGLRSAQIRARCLMRSGEVPWAIVTIRYWCYPKRVFDLILKMVLGSNLKYPDFGLSHSECQLI